MKNQKGAALVEFSVLISLVVLVTVLSIRHFSWKVRCNTAVAGWAITMYPLGYSNLVAGVFGNCQFIPAYGGMEGGVKMMQDYLCDLDVDSGWVRMWREPCGL